MPLTSSSGAFEWFALTLVPNIASHKTHWRNPSAVAILTCEFASIRWTKMPKEVVRVVLFAPGSEDSRVRKPFEELAQGLRNELGKNVLRLAYIQFASPNLAEVAEEAANDGVARLRVLPLLLTPGGPLDKEIPEQVSVVRAQVPQLTVEVLPSVGEHPRMRTLLHALAREAAKF